MKALQAGVNGIMKRYLTVLFVSAALAGSVSVRAEEHEHRRNKQDKRYYDRDARDYHVWNQNENRAYREYAKESQKRDREFAKMNRKERQEYFKWRHNHPDQDRR